MEEKKENYDQTMEDLFNVWIVAHGGRKACLIESANYKGNFLEKVWNSTIRPLVVSLQLYSIVDKFSPRDYPRILVSREKLSYETHQELGKLLGFSYLKDDFDNFLLPRYGVHIILNSNEIKKLPIWTEVSLDLKNSEKNVKNLVHLWNHIVKKYHYDYLTNIKIYYEIHKNDGLLHRIKMLNDSDYFKKNYSEYLNDIENFYPNTEIIEEVMDSIRKFPENNAQEKKVKTLWIRSTQNSLNLL